MKNIEKYGLKVPEILLPADKNLSTWAVIACDQYTQSESYWNQVKECIGDKPSTLNIIYPEVYLGESNRKLRIENIRSTMKSYLEDGVFDSPEKEMIYIERTTAYGRTRKGLLAALDLETYEWKPMSKALVRATEATIVDRIPPRKEIRMNAPVELPHIMLLANDPDRLLVEATGKQVRNSEPVYDGDLMLNSGHITGWSIKDENILESIGSALENLAKKNTCEDGSVFLFAVGDGNHSLATAKAVWDEYKVSACPEDNLNDSPVRYALVEIVNIYDEGLTFEPIHRVLFTDKNQELMDTVCDKLSQSYHCEIEDYDNAEDFEKAIKESDNTIGFTFSGSDSKVLYKAIRTDISELAVSVLQPLLDDFVKEKGCEIDYIHGTEEVLRLSSNPGSVCIMLPPINKESFFDTISSRGPLPRKSFSMGEASEKRFYVECRKLFY